MAFDDVGGIYDDDLVGFGAPAPLGGNKKKAIVRKKKSGDPGTKTGGGGKRWTTAGQPDCGPGKTARYVGPYDEATGDAIGGGDPSHWECVGGGGGFGGGPGGGGGGGFNYQTPTYTGPARPQYNFQPAPGLDLPDFEAPDPEGIYADPSYQFRLSEGQKALERSAAARGTLLSGGTAKAITGWAQNFASQEYQNIWGRAVEAYNLQIQTLLDEYAPRFAEWEILTDAERDAGNREWQRRWDMYTFGINDQFRRQQMIFQAGLS